MNVYESTCIDTCAPKPGVLRHYFQPYSPEKVLSLNLKLGWQVIASAILPLSPQHVAYKWAWPQLASYVCAGDLNSVPHVCVTNALSTESPSQLQL